MKEHVGCGCFPTGRHYPGIAHLLRVRARGTVPDLDADAAWTALPIAVLDTETTGRDPQTDRIVEIVRSEFPLVRVLARSYDRQHALKLIGAGVDFQVRETFESALAFSEAALRTLGVPEEEATETVAEVRRRDAERLQLELAGGLGAGRAAVLGNAPKPTPFTQPTRPAQPLSEETAVVTADKT